MNEGNIDFFPYIHERLQHHISDKRANYCQRDYLKNYTP